MHALKETDLADRYMDCAENFTALRAGPYHKPGNITLKFNQHIETDHLGYVIE